MLGLVEEDVAEFLLLVEVHVALERVVCRHDDVDARERLQLCRPLRLRASDGHGLKGWGKATDFLKPVVEQRGRRDDEGRPRPLLFAREQEGDDLQCLAEAHVVGEDAAEVVVGKAREPVEARDLIVAQHRLQRDGHLVVGLLRLADAAHDLAEAAAARELQALVLAGQRVEVHGFRERQLELAAREVFLLEPRVLHELGNRAQLLVTERHEAPVLHAVVALLLAVGVEDVEELRKVDILHVEGDLEEVHVVDADARRDLRHGPHGPPLEALLVEDLDGVRQLLEALREEVVALLLVELDELVALLREAVARKDGEELLLRLAVAHEQVMGVCLRRRLHDGVEADVPVDEDRLHRDARALVVEVELGGERHEQELLLKGRVDVDVRDLLDGRQDIAEERRHVGVRELHARRAGKRLPERLQGAPERFIHPVDALRLVEQAAVLRQGREVPVIEADAAVLAADAADIEMKLRLPLAQVRRDGLTAVDVQLDGLLAHDGEERRKQARRQMHHLVLEDRALLQRVHVGERRLMAQQALLVEIRLLHKGPELFRDAVGPAQRGHVDHAAAAERVILPRHHALQEFHDIAHDVEAAHADAELEPALDLAGRALDEEARDEVDGLLQRGRCQLLCRPEALQQAAAARIRAGCPSVVCHLLLDSLEHGDDVLAGAEILRRGRAVAVEGLDLIARLGQADADVIRLRPRDDSRVAPAICLTLQLRHRTAPEVPDTALVRGIRRHGPDLLLINHGIPAFPLPDNYAKIK